MLSLPLSLLLLQVLLSLLLSLQVTNGFTVTAPYTHVGLPRRSVTTTTTSTGPSFPTNAISINDFLTLARPRPNINSNRQHHLHLQMTVFDAIFNTYSSSLEQHPLLTKATTGLVLCSIADIIAQVRRTRSRTVQMMNINDVEMKMKISMDNLRLYIDSIDTKRLTRFATKGFFSAIIWGAWYDLSAQIVSVDNILSVSSSLGLLDADLNLVENGVFIAVVRTASSIIIEQFIACPIIFGMWEIPAATILNNAALKQIPYEVNDKLGGMLVANAKVWTLANIIIYNVPVQYRVGLSNVIDIFWQSIVSDIAADCGKATDDNNVGDDSLCIVAIDDDNNGDKNRNTVLLAQAQVRNSDEAVVPQEVS